MKIHIPNSAFLGNIDPFLRNFDTSNPEMLEITANKQWISIHPMVIAMIAALGLSLEFEKIKCETMEARSKHYLKRMGLFDFLKIDSGIEIIENDSEDWVYDITIEPNHAFVSQAAILHNTVTISKANVQASLSAQTSVLAAGNPKYGRFEPTQPISQQIDLPPALINRFDIIFTMRDIPNVGNDTKVADHILEEHQREAKEMIIDKNLFRKYIAYARQRIKPKLTDEAVNKMKEFYVGLRNRPMIEGQEMKSIPISARQLNSLIRMAEATAKLRMSEKVEEEDAKIAIDLLKYYLMQVGFDEETGEIDIDKISGKMKSSQRNKIFLVRDTIHNLTKEFGELVSIEKIEERLEGKSTPEEIEDAIERLAKEGTIFKPRRGFVQKL